ncbi:phosphopantetheine-binding protein [Micromonospora sp. CPCC 206060]|uniref:Acyl carrier protein n=1 Tax=Micromonospora echinofusca TaxID=47858 RepID=A0ABS3VQ05_MICEH|nr:phosphopantetheine-binding protein [Micromonospora echinofusca]MBO4206618.1 acyl carrier protein [Micromonospora echinofusca]
MNHDDALTLVRDILTDHLGLDAEQIVAGANMREDLGMDSLDAVEMISALEKQIGTRLDPAEIEAVQTIADVVDVLLRHSPVGALR